MKTLLRDLFDGTDAREMSENLTLLLENFIHKAEVDNITKANSASLVNKIIISLFQCEEALKEDHRALLNGEKIIDNVSTIRNDNF
jgi:hypothetical protein